MTSYKPIHYLDGSFKTQAGLKSSHGHAPSTHRPIDQYQGSKERRLRHHEKSTLGQKPKLNILLYHFIYHHWCLA